MIQKLFDGRNIIGVIFTGKANGGACGPCPSGSPDAVNIVLGILGEVVVDDVTDLIDMKAAGGHIRGHEDSDFSASEIL